MEGVENIMAEMAESAQPKQDRRMASKKRRQSDMDAKSAQVPTEVPTEPEEKKEKEFRLQAKCYFLTYSEKDVKHMDKESLLKELYAKHPGVIKKLVACNEKTADGDAHCHAVVWFTKKIDSKDVTYFDLPSLGHPNIQARPGKKAKEGEKKPKMSPKEWEISKEDYVMKDGDYGTYPPEWEIGRPKGRKGYVKERQDFEAWKADCQNRKLKSPFPFTMHDGTKVEAPGLYEKKSNWLVIGSSDMGKTTHLKKQLEGSRHMFVVEWKAGMKWDHYNKHELIVFDDCLPSEEFCKVFPEPTYEGDAGAYMSARYNDKPLEVGKRRMIIIICNHERKPAYMNEEWFKNRFNVIWMDKKDDSVAPNTPEYWLKRLHAAELELALCKQQLKQWS